MRILITGVAGFIGFHITKKCLDNGYEVLGIDNLCDYYDIDLKKNRLKELYKSKNKKLDNFKFVKANLENHNLLNDLFKEFKPECVVHLAAQAGVRYSLLNPQAYIQSNLVGFSNIIELSKQFDIRNFIYASSSSVYGGEKDMPFHENAKVGHPISLYAATKRSNELIAHTYSNLFNLPCTGLRFFTVYGPWGRPDMAYFSFTDSIINGKSIQVFNNGNMMRDLTYVDDVCQSLIKLINKPALPDNNFDKNIPNLSSSWCPYRVFNIGNSNPIKLLDFIEIIEDVLNIKAKKEFMPMQPGDVKATYADCSSLEKWIGFQPKTSFKEGIEKFIKWYLTYYKKIN